MYRQNFRYRGGPDPRGFGYADEDGINRQLSRPFSFYDQRNEAGQIGGDHGSIQGASNADYGEEQNTRRTPWRGGRGPLLPLEYSMWMHDTQDVRSNTTTTVGDPGPFLPLEYSMRMPDTQDVRSNSTTTVGDSGNFNRALLPLEYNMWMSGTQDVKSNSTTTVGDQASHHAPTDRNKNWGSLNLSSQRNRHLLETPPDVAELRQEQAPLDLTKVKKSLNCQVCQMGFETFEEYQTHADSLLHINNAALAAERSLNSRRNSAGEGLDPQTDQRPPKPAHESRPKRKYPYQNKDHRYNQKYPKSKEPTFASQASQHFISHSNEPSLLGSGPDFNQNSILGPATNQKGILGPATKKKDVLGLPANQNNLRPVVNQSNLYMPLTNQSGLLGPGGDTQSDRRNILSQALQASVGIYEAILSQDVGQSQVIGSQRTGSKMFQNPNRTRYPSRGSRFSAYPSRNIGQRGALQPQGNFRTQFQPGNRAYNERPPGTIVGDRASVHMDFDVSAPRHHDVDSKALKPDSSSCEEPHTKDPDFGDSNILEGDEAMNIELNFRPPHDQSPAANVSSMAEGKDQDSESKGDQNEAKDSDEDDYLKPIGQDFVVPVTGFFCRLCSRFYNKESVAKIDHCKTKQHVANFEARQG